MWIIRLPDRVTLAAAILRVCGFLVIAKSGLIVGRIGGVSAGQTRYEVCVHWHFQLFLFLFGLEDFSSVNSDFRVCSKRLLCRHLLSFLVYRV